MRGRLASGGPVVLALLAIGALGVGLPHGRVAAASPGLYIALGDSVAAGIGSSLPRTRSYPAIVDARLQRWEGATVTLANLAQPGETAASFRGEGQLAKLRDQAALAAAGGAPIVAVTVTLGGNEILEAQGQGLADRQTALATFQNEYDAALSDIREAVGDGPPIVVTNYYDPTGGDSALQYSDSWWIAQFNSAIAMVASAHGAALADVQPGFAALGPAADRYPVDVHPTNAGHAAIADAVWKALGLDTSPPTMSVVGSLNATTRMPTLRIKVDDPGDVAGIMVTSSDAATYPLIPAPAADGPDVWVGLIDATGIVGDTFSVTIDATDAAGNAASTTVMYHLPTNPEARP